MTPTDEIQAKLDELGVAWWQRKCHTCWKVEKEQDTEHWRAWPAPDGTITLKVDAIYGLTPEQAIATTMEPNKTKEWRSVALGLFDSLEKADLEVAQRWLCENDLLRQEIAYGDAKATTVGDRGPLTVSEFMAHASRVAKELADWGDA